VRYPAIAGYRGDRGNPLGLTPGYSCGLLVGPDAGAKAHTGRGGALANKMAQGIGAMLSRDEYFREPVWPYRVSAIRDGTRTRISGSRARRITGQVVISHH